MRKPLGIACGVLCAALAIYYGWRWLSRERSESPAEFARLALQGDNPDKQEQAAARLEGLAGRALTTGKRNPSQEHLAAVLAESKTPGVRVACMRGLTTIWDYSCMPLMLDLLDDESPLVRNAAAKAIQTLMGVDCHFNAEDPPEKRKAVVDRLREHWKLFDEKKREKWEQRLEKMDAEKGHL